MSNNSESEPAWILQARSLFALIKQRADLNEYDQVVYVGKLFDLFRETGASNGNYSKIVRLLEAHGVIRYVQRGNRYQSSVIEVTGELQRSPLLPPDHLTTARHSATLELAEQEKRLARLETWRERLSQGGDIVEVLQDFELRITQLEREVQKIGSYKAKAKESR